MAMSILRADHGAHHPECVPDAHAEAGVVAFFCSRSCRNEHGLEAGTSQDPYKSTIQRRRSGGGSSPISESPPPQLSAAVLHRGDFRPSCTWPLYEPESIRFPRLRSPAASVPVFSGVSETVRSYGCIGKDRILSTTFMRRPPLSFTIAVRRQN